MSKFLTLPEVLKEAMKYYNKNPSYEVHSSSEITHKVPNPTGIGYDDIIEVFACERFVRFKYRNPELLVEYQLDMMPWSNSFSYLCWYDGPDQKCPWEVSPNRGTKYIETEEEFFQASTVHDLKDLTLDVIKEVKKLQDHMFQYYKITPDSQNWSNK